ncbi:hypothetical protein L917_00241 [Phytophthora nicotianae]|uniref:Uncharacterized protein n=1 Tax=Phytophthora nicotianae TaxID=4792 RepID=W2M1C6_PHYNI|nr:hypothetical protein L917_00241 [Phytophthora nicotianae]
MLIELNDAWSDSGRSPSKEEDDLISAYDSDDDDPYLFVEKSSNERLLKDESPVKYCGRTFSEL